MGVKRWLGDCLNLALRRYGKEIVQTESLYEWQRHVSVDQSSWNDCPLTDEAKHYLRPDNPKLVELSRRYSAYDADVTAPLVWNDRNLSPDDIAYFRGDNAWVWQVRGTNANLLAYALTLYYLKSIDRLGLFERLGEDESFGVFTFQIGGRSISRDLLDSISEIYFLDRHLGIASRQGLRILDIGAGYGRLAHRMTAALPGIDQYLCTDAVAISTFVSDYYLQFRGAAKTRVVPLDQIDTTLHERRIDLAINVHSFSECRPSAIDWWARLLARHSVKNLMIVPNRTSSGGERLLTNDGYDFLPILERYGYRLVLKEPKFLDPVVQQYGLQPSWYHLLELQT